MNFSLHPLHRLVKTFSLHSTDYQNAQRMAAELDDLFTILEALQPGDVTAFDMLRRTSALLTTITQHYGGVHGWTRQQQGKVHHEANRLLPAGHEFHGPIWSES
jgi:tagatose-1,6-bisphosphate aldolase non-catalytic subunit AgaZ/GatZ